MLLAMLLGTLTGFRFAPIALIPLASLDMLFMITLWSLSGTLDTNNLTRLLIHLILLNFGYLIGAMLRRYLCQGRDHSPNGH